MKLSLFATIRAQMTGFYAQAGILLNDATLKAWGKRYVMEYLKYAVYPSTAHAEMYRSHGTNADQGWSYSAINFAKMLEIADSFARMGDVEPFEECAGSDSWLCAVASPFTG